MNPETLISHLAALIGQTYTAEDHAAVVAHLTAVERLAQDVIAMRERARVRVTQRAANPFFADVDGSEGAV